jgi:hypothetical protein
MCSDLGLYVPCLCAVFAGNAYVKLRVTEKGYAKTNNVFIPFGLSVTSASATNGSIAGGTSVTFQGRGFQYWNISMNKVRFGNLDGVVTAVTASSITALSPPLSVSSATPVTVTVSALYRNLSIALSATSPTTFTYDPASVRSPTITSVTPTTGVAGTRYASYS